MIPFDNVISYQVAHLQFGDKRLDARCKFSFQKMESRGFNKSFPHIFQAVNNLRNFYDFMNNDKVTSERFNDGYLNGLIRYFQSTDQPCDYLFNYQDTTFGKYHNRQVKLGYLETENDNGLAIHSGILTGPDYIPLGISHQQHIIRDKADFGKSAKRKQISFAAKESYKWISGIDWAIQFNKEIPIPVVQVSDRESDIAAYFNYAFENKQFFIVRSMHNRKVIGEEELLWEYIQQQEVYLKTTRSLRSEDGKFHEVTCSVRYAEVSCKEVDEPIWVIYLQAIDPPEQMEETRWFLLTNLPLEEEQLPPIRIIDAYTKRWRTTEDFHKCLKTGCSIEQRQFKSPEALINAIAFLSIAAVRLLRMRHLGQTNPNAPLQTILEETEIEVAKAIAPQFLKPKDLEYCKPETVLWWSLLLGRMGGHIGIKQKGLPGWITMSRGWDYFHNIVVGFKLSKNIFKFSHST